MAINAGDLLIERDLNPNATIFHILEDMRSHLDGILGVSRDSGAK